IIHRVRHFTVYVLCNSINASSSSAAWMGFETKESPGPIRRFPTGFWACFNEWWHSEFARQGRRPNSKAINKWHAENALKIWGESAVSCAETQRHANRMKRRRGGQPSQRNADDECALEDIDQETTPLEIQNSTGGSLAVAPCDSRNPPTTQPQAAAAASSLDPDNPILPSAQSLSQLPPLRLTGSGVCLPSDFPTAFGLMAPDTDLPSPAACSVPSGLQLQPQHQQERTQHPHLRGELGVRTLAAVGSASGALPNQASWVHPAASPEQLQLQLQREREAAAAPGQRQLQLQQRQKERQQQEEKGGQQQQVVLQRIKQEEQLRDASEARAVGPDAAVSWIAWASFDSQQSRRQSGRGAGNNEAAGGAPFTTAAATTATAGAADVAPPATGMQVKLESLAGCSGGGANGVGYGGGFNDWACRESGGGGEAAAAKDSMPASAQPPPSDRGSRHHPEVGSAAASPCTGEHGHGMLRSPLPSGDAASGWQRTEVAAAAAAAAATAVRATKLQRRASACHSGLASVGTSAATAAATTVAVAAVADAGGSTASPPNPFLLPPHNISPAARDAAALLKAASQGEGQRRLNLEDPRVAPVWLRRVSQELDSVLAATGLLIAATASGSGPYCAATSMLQRPMGQQLALTSLQQQIWLQRTHKKPRFLDAAEKLALPEPRSKRDLGAFLRQRVDGQATAVAGSDGGGGGSMTASSGPPVGLPAARASGNGHGSTWLAAGSSAASGVTTCYAGQYLGPAAPQAAGVQDTFQDVAAMHWEVDGRYGLGLKSLGDGDLGPRAGSAPRCNLTSSAGLCMVAGSRSYNITSSNSHAAGLASNGSYCEGPRMAFETGIGGNANGYAGMRGVGTGGGGLLGLTSMIDDMPFESLLL
ncbi:hypothetical protein Agub_g3462, partial [Astrephomene gubernaculifera]